MKLNLIMSNLYTEVHIAPLDGKLKKCLVLKFIIW